jgi:histone H3/H4
MASLLPINACGASNLELTPNQLQQNYTPPVITGSCRKRWKDIKIVAETKLEQPQALAVQYQATQDSVALFQDKKGPEHPAIRRLIQVSTDSQTALEALVQGQVQLTFQPQGHNKSMLVHWECDQTLTGDPWLPAGTVWMPIRTQRQTSPLVQMRELRFSEPVEEEEEEEDEETTGRSVHFLALRSDLPSPQGGGYAPTPWVLCIDNPEIIVTPQIEQQWNRLHQYQLWDAMKKAQPKSTKLKIRAKPSKRHYKPGTVALREIRQQQKRVNLIVPRAPFQRLVNEIGSDFLKNMDGGIRFSKDAREALQEAAEFYLIQLFRDLNYCATSDKRQTILPRDYAKVKYFSRGGSDQPFLPSKH